MSLWLLLFGVELALSDVKSCNLVRQDIFVSSMDSKNVSEIDGHLWQCIWKSNLEWIISAIFNLVHINQFAAVLTLESPLDCKEIQPVHPKGNQSWIFIGRTDVEGELPVLWPSDAKSWLIWKDPDAGKDWRREEKGTTEDGWMASPTQWTWVWANSRS